MPKKRLSNENDPGPSTSKKRREAQSQALSQIRSQEIISNSFNQNWLRSGKVMRIRLTNFMCHSHFQIDFNSRVNLLIGRNGSGKSAILSALIVGLGARSNATSRSTNLKSFIKSGENQASIEIEIANVGDDAYNIDKYGERIIIKRKLMASGGSQYEIKDHSGHTLSKSRDDLMRILLFHNIQTDNPVFVLNQDAARSFLKDLDPAKCYNLFLKATQIELIAEKLNDCARIYRDNKSRLVVNKKVLEKSEDEVNQLCLKYERLKSVEDIKENIVKFKLQHDWLKVTHQEETIKRLHDEINTKEQQIREIQQAIDDKNDDSTSKGSLQYLQKEVIAKNAILEKEIRILLNLQNAHKEETNKLQVETQQQKKLMGRVKHYKDQIDTIEEELNQRTESSSSRNDRLRKEVEEKRENLDKKRTDVEAMINTLKQELKINAQHKEKQTEEYQEVEAQKNKYQSSISLNQHELTRISSLSNDRTEIYGNHMSSLLTHIERAHKAGKFTAMPKGPLGRYLEASDKKWRDVIEQLLGGMLTSFLVNNGKDRIVLDKILKTNFPRANHTIITSQFRGRVYDVASGRVPKIRDTHLLMDLIKCSDSDVMNCLIDQARIETILIVENRGTAEYLTSNRENVPPNLQKVLLTNPLMEYYPSPLYRAYSLKARPPRYIQVNMDERKATLQQELKRIQDLVRQIQSKLQSIRVTLGDFDEYHKQKQSLLRKHESTLNQIKVDLEQLDNYEFPSENEDAVLRKELEQLQVNLKQSQTRLTDHEGTSIKLKQDIIDKNKEVQKQHDVVKKIEMEVNSLMEELNTKKVEASKMNRNLKVLTEKSESLNSSLQQLKANVDTEEQRLSSLEEHARKSGDRISTKKSDQELSTLITSLEVKVREICSYDENIEEVEALLLTKEAKVKKDRQCMTLIMENLELMCKARQQRFKTLKNLHEHMAIRVSHTFKHILKIRQFDGELEIDCNNKTLTMTVVPRDKHIEDAVSTTKSLSGGERSFATVALLLSLWSCIDHPFYFLDEYDVFTDEFNRKVITKLLLSEAMKKEHRQYTFLSPQDMSFVEPSDKITIHKLADPSASQQE